MTEMINRKFYVDCITSTELMTTNQTFKARLTKQPNRVNQFIDLFVNIFLSCDYQKSLK